MEELIEALRSRSDAESQLMYLETVGYELAESIRQSAGRKQLLARELTELSNRVARLKEQLVPGAKVFAEKQEAEMRRLFTAVLGHVNELFARLGRCGISAAVFPSPGEVDEAVADIIREVVPGRPFKRKYRGMRGSIIGSYRYGSSDAEDYVMVRLASFLDRLSLAFGVSRDVCTTLLRESSARSRRDAKMYSFRAYADCVRIEMGALVKAHECKSPRHDESVVEIHGMNVEL